MVGTKLVSSLVKEAKNYLGIPYFTNRPPLPGNPENVFVGKGTWQQIRAVSSAYNFLKKNHIGIDCSGLAVNLLNFYGLQINKNINLNPRKLSANLLTSYPLAYPINPQDTHTADLIRTKNGRHVIFILKKNPQSLLCVDSSRQGRGVAIFKLPLSQLGQNKQAYRLFLLD